MTANQTTHCISLPVAAWRAARIALLLMAYATVTSGSATAQNAADSALIAAAERGDAASVERLLKQGASAKARDGTGRTALLAATQHNRIEVVRELLKTRVALDHVNKLGWTCLLEAVILGDGGARHTEIVRLAVAAGANVNLADRDGATPLRHARARGQHAIAQLLEAAGARP